MEEIVNYQCIDFIIHWYIMMVAKAPFNIDEQESQVLSIQAFQMLDVCKSKSLQQLNHES